MTAPALRSVPGGRVDPPIPPETQRLMATNGLRVVRKLAREFATATDCGLVEEDFLSLGQSVMARVAGAYDSTTKTLFTTYIFPYVKGAMRDAVRRRRLELGTQGLVAEAIAHEQRRFSSMRSDEFDVLHNTVEETGRALDRDLSDLAASLAGSAVATACEAMRRGTEDHLAEVQSLALAGHTIERRLADTPHLRRLWEVYYCEERPLKECCALMGISNATVGRYHAELKEIVRAALAERGIHEMPCP